MAESNKGEQMFYPMTQQFSVNTQQICDPKNTKDKHKHVHGRVVSVPQRQWQPGSSGPPPTYRWKVSGQSLHHSTLRLTLKHCLLSRHHGKGESHLIMYFERKRDQTTFTQPLLQSVITLVNLLLSLLLHFIMYRKNTVYTGFWDFLSTGAHGMYPPQIRGTTVFVR